MTEKLEKMPVLISGAGPVGLALALGLSRCGVRSVVIEKKPALSTHSKAAAVLARTMEIFHAWGISQTFISDGQWLQRVTPRDPKGRGLFTMNFGVLADVSPTPGICVLPQNETERILYEACAASGMVEVRFGHELKNLESGAAAVRVEVAAPSGAYGIECDFLCGCDGPRSTVREKLGLHLEGKTYDAHAVLADVVVSESFDPAEIFRADPSVRGLNAMIQFQPHNWRLVIAVPGGTDEGLPQESFIKAKTRALLGVTPTSILWSSSFKIHCRNAESFRSGRVTLLGDAAHLNSPAGGQGMNSGIQDAHNLAWKIASALQGGDTEQLLDSYNRERQDAIRNGVDVFTDRITRVGISSAPWIRALVLRYLRFRLRSHDFVVRAAKGAGMLNFKYAPTAFVDSSGGTVAENAFRCGPSSRGRIFERGGMYRVVRPDDVIAYQGRDKKAAERWLSTIARGAAGAESAPDAVANS